MFYIINFTWSLIQNIVGFIALLYVKLTHKNYTITRYKKAYVIDTHYGFGDVSLGMFIFLRSTPKEDVMHEYGHTIQSMILGPAYLLIIGLPSFLWCRFGNYKGDQYYNFPTEKWADKLGRVQRYK